MLIKEQRIGEARTELARAELAGELSELYVLNFHALLAMVEGSALASDYLEMAEAVASSCQERAVVAESRAAHDLLQGNLISAAERCLATLDEVWQTEGLWKNLLIALHRLGEVAALDATLRGFAQLNDPCVARLVETLLSEPELREIHARPAFRGLLDRGAVM